MSHRSFVGAAVNNTLLPYANAMKAKAALLGVEVLDLNLRSVEYFGSVGNALLATNIFDTGTLTLDYGNTPPNVRPGE